MLPNPWCRLSRANARAARLGVTKSLWQGGPASTPAGAGLSHSASEGSLHTAQLLGSPQPPLTRGAGPQQNARLQAAARDAGVGSSRVLGSHEAGPTSREVAREGMILSAGACGSSCGGQQASAWAAAHGLSRHSNDQIMGALGMMAGGLDSVQSDMPGPAGATRSGARLVSL